MGESKEKVETANYLYVESIKEGPISALDPKSKVRIDLYKGLNKIKKSVWESCKSLPMIKAYVDAKTLIEKSGMRCMNPADQGSPEKMDQAVADKKQREADAMKAKADTKPTPKVADKKADTPKENAKENAK